jgi:sialate O-acetylesterase
MRSRSIIALLPLVVLFQLCRPALATVAVKPPFANSMVLQREMPVPIWGTATSGEQVSVTLGTQAKTVATPTSGKWTVTLDPMAAAGPLTMTIKGTNTVTLTDVYVGEVWQAGGQSNMDTRLNYYSNLASEINSANLPMLRYYTLRQPGQTTTWEVVSPTTAGPLSALGYFVGKEIQKATGLAVGLVVTAVGGTRITAWLDPATLAANPSITDSDKGSMWNQWVAPVVGYAMRGTVWIQGEQNCNSADAPTYGAMFNLLIKGWRAAWGQGDFPFYYGSLSNIHSAQTDPNNTSTVAQVREGQRLALALANTAMSVNFDIGTPNNWHFPNKAEAGRRLALPARAKLYGETSLVYSGPLYRTKTISGGKVTLFFDSVGGGLVAQSGGALSGFAIAGATGNWVWGDAVISGDTVVVSSTSVTTPTRVRYGWGDDPVISLFNKDGLPAPSFTTESPDITPAPGGTGGASGSGGSPGTGGAIGTGGSTGAGGAIGAGGATATGGAAGTGGTTRTGGTIGAGGTIVAGGTTSAGGSLATGGAGVVASGGSRSTGGSLATGGTTIATGGTTSSMSGGTVATSGGNANGGGATASGGAVPSGGVINAGGIPSIAGTSAAGTTGGTGTRPTSSGGCSLAGQSSRSTALVSLGLLGLTVLRSLRRRRAAAALNQRQARRHGESDVLAVGRARIPDGFGRTNSRLWL